MQAVRFIGVGRPAHIDDIPKPSAGPGQVLIKVGGARVCQLIEVIAMRAPIGSTLRRLNSLSRRPWTSIRS